MVDNPICTSKIMNDRNDKSLVNLGKKHFIKWQYITQILILWFSFGITT